LPDASKKGLVLIGALRYPAFMINSVSLRRNARRS